MKAITFFRLYSKTRYLINAVKECSKDTIPFIIILFYLTFTFALTIYNLQVMKSDGKSTSIKFGPAWTEAYLLNFNSFNTDDYDALQ